MTTPNDSQQANATSPDWKVLAVFDPAGTGSDFAYTIGLANQGLPELHMWARPTHGDDVGWDFKLSPQDLQQILNRYARRLIDGAVVAGGTYSEDVDGGLSALVIEAGDTVDAETVDAFQAGAGTPVIPLRWELRRPDIGVDGGLDEHWTEVFDSSLRYWIRSVDELDGDTSSLPDPDAGPAAVDATYGPWTPVLEAIRATLATGHDQIPYQMSVYAPFVRRDLGGVAGITGAAARIAGRVDAHAAALAAAEDDAVRFGELVGRYVADDDGVDTELVDALTRALGQVLGACYGAVVVREHIDGPTWQLATGLVVAATDPDGADETFWEDERTATIARSAAELEPDQVRALGVHALSLGDAFDAALLSARAISSISGDGVPSSGGGCPENVDDADVYYAACDAIDAAALAVCLPDRAEVELLNTPWAALDVTS